MNTARIVKKSLILTQIIVVHVSKGEIEMNNTEYMYRLVNCPETLSKEQLAEYERGMANTRKEITEHHNEEASVGLL